LNTAQIGVEHVSAPSAGVVGAPQDVVGDRLGDIEGRREAGVAGEPGDVDPQTGVTTTPPGVRELAVGGRPAAGELATTRKFAPAAQNYTVCRLAATSGCFRLSK
jgi:hypothetical protein